MNLRQDTIINLIIVLVPLGLIPALILPRWIDRTDEVKMTKAQLEISALEDSLNLFWKDHGRYPSAEEGLKALLMHNNLQTKPCYVGSIVDPWGNSYNYRFPGTENVAGYDLWSYGADNAPGSAGPNGDIGNWTTE